MTTISPRMSDDLMHLGPAGGYAGHVHERGCVIRHGLPLRRRKRFLLLLLGVERDFADSEEWWLASAENASDALVLDIPAQARHPGDDGGVHFLPVAQRLGMVEALAGLHNRYTLDHNRRAIGRAARAEALSAGARRQVDAARAARNAPSPVQARTRRTRRSCSWGATIFEVVTTALAAVAARLACAIMLVWRIRPH